MTSSRTPIKAANIFQVDVVIHGNSMVFPDAQGVDPYEEPKKRGVAVIFL